MNRPILTPKADKNIIEVPINKIIIWKDNPRKNDKAVPKIAEIFKTRGQINPVVVWRKNGVCYAGNTRLKAAKLLGWKTVKVLYVDFPSEAAAIAYGIADNKSSEWTEWDDSILSNFLKIEDIGKQCGFTVTESAALLNIKLQHASQEIDYDQIWQGLPEYSNSSEKPFHSMIIHCKTEADFKDFSKRLGQNFTEKTRSAWHPKKEQVKVGGILEYRRGKK